MCYQHFVLFACFIKICSSESYQGWNYINLHCRDNENRPVDWWYMYKPPAEVIPFYELGRDFVFITSETAGRWQQSGRSISANSMLQHTMAPMFRPTYTDYLAVLSYDDQKGDGVGLGSSSLGVMMADEVGGVWIGHTVPGLINLTKDRPSFPEKELANGHLLMCLSLDLIVLNQLSVLLQKMNPRILRVQIPTLMRPYLPDWNFLDSTVYKPKGWKQTTLDFITKNKTLRAKALIRMPGNKKCPYSRFAKNMNLVLDVYGHPDKNIPHCYSNYSVRKIDKISMKSVDYVHYVSRGRDRSAFAVSTAAYWQKTGGSGHDQYWTCVGPADDVPAKGGLLMCVDQYYVWQSFDNFKVKEPQC